MADDKQLAQLIADAEYHKANPDGQAFIEWHNSVSDAIRQHKPYSAHLASAFHRSRQDTGSLTERYDAAIKVLRHVWAHDEMPTEKPDKTTAKREMSAKEYDELATTKYTGHSTVEPKPLNKAQPEP